jgi:hypothetical protein
MRLDYIRKWIIFTTLFGLTVAIERPDYILPCNKKDPQINSCIKKTFNHLRGYLAKGLPELDVPPMEPLRINQLAMENNAGNIRIKALFSDILAYGASNWTVKEVRTDVKKLRIDMSLSIPRVETKGRYEVIGQVLLLPVRSAGEFWTEFTDISAIAKIYGKQVIRDEEAYMAVDKMVIDFVMKGARFKVKDQIAQTLNEAINQFLNQNANEIIQEMRPAASQSIAKVFRGLLQKAFSKLPMRLWLLD